MPRASGIKQISLTSGFITEQSKLTPVEGSTTDELNFTYNDDGSIRQRRKGINKEEDAEFYTLGDIVNDTNASAYRFWDSVGGDGSLNFHVFQIGATLHFIKDADGNLTDQRQSFIFDLDDMVTAAYSSVEDAPVSMTSGEGKLFVVSQKVEPFYIEYDATGDTISSTFVDIRVRDLTGLDDTLEIDERIGTLSEEHDYNLNNQGWWQQRRIVAAGAFEDPIAQFFTINAVYPSNADIALLGVVDDGSGNLIFKEEELLDLTLGNTPASKGHFIINPFNILYDDLRTGTDTGGGGYGGSSGSSGGTDPGGGAGEPPWWDDPVLDEK